MKSDFNNWLTDFNAFPQQNDFSGNVSDIDQVHAQGQLHKGFLDAYLTLRTQIIAALNVQLAAYPSYSVVATGHSLGGALATLFVSDIVDRVVNASSLTAYTYGQPRVGDKTFADDFDQRFGNFWRVINYADRVPHDPSIGYQHVAGEVWFYSTGKHARAFVLHLSFLQAVGDTSCAMVAKMLIAPIACRLHRLWLTI